MRAADPVENSVHAGVARIDRPGARHHPAPVYAKRADDGLGTGTLSLGVELRRQPAQLAQWLIVFGALGLVIGGAKWLNARHVVEPEQSVATYPAADTSLRRGAVLAGRPPGTTLQRGTVRAKPTPDPSISPAPAQTLPAPTVRAPASVPYPRRIHDVQPQVPGNVATKRGIAVLSLLIDTAGNVTEVQTLRGLDPELDAAAIAAARLWKFEPTTHRGRPVAVRANFTVTFGY